MDVKCLAAMAALCIVLPLRADDSPREHILFSNGIVNPAKDASSLFDPQQYISPPIHVDGGVITPAVITESTTPIPSIVPKIQ